MNFAKFQEMNKINAFYISTNYTITKFVPEREERVEIMNYDKKNAIFAKKIKFEKTIYNSIIFK